jgi:hypothetical protein
MRYSKNELLLLIFLSFFFLQKPFTSTAQFLEFGGGAGVMNYNGDLNRGYPTENMGLGVTIFHRMNFSEIVSIKYAGTFGKISGTDQQAFDALGLARNRSFSRSLVEASLVFEYNFLDFKNEKSQVRWSPYLFGGLGFTRLFGDRNGDYSMVQTVLPFGIGYKQLLGKQFAIGLELGLRRTFFDELDYVSAGDYEIKDFQYGNPENKDWYSFAGFTVSYILYRIPCPFRYVPNGSIYR